MYEKKKGCLVDIPHEHVEHWSRQKNFDNFVEVNGCVLQNKQATHKKKY